jgi:hypothetical protein
MQPTDDREQEQDFAPSTHLINFKETGVLTSCLYFYDRSGTASNGEPSIFPWRSLVKYL